MIQHHRTMPKSKIERCGEIFDFAASEVFGRIPTNERYEAKLVYMIL